MVAKYSAVALSNSRKCRLYCKCAWLFSLCPTLKSHHRPSTSWMYSGDQASYLAERMTAAVVLRHGHGDVSVGMIIPSKLVLSQTPGGQYPMRFCSLTRDFQSKAKPCFAPRAIETSNRITARMMFYALLLHQKLSIVARS